MLNMNYKNRLLYMFYLMASELNPLQVCVDVPAIFVIPCFVPCEGFSVPRHALIPILCRHSAFPLRGRHLTTIPKAQPTTVYWDVTLCNLVDRY